jgi:hypothetical protein
MSGRRFRLSALATASTIISAIAIRTVSAAVPAVCFVVQTGTVYDARTKLTWQQVITIPSTDTNLQNKNPTAYCAALSLNGGGWRVPRTRELESIVDYTRTSPAIDPVAFPNTPTDLLYWTSSPHPFTAGTGYVDFTSGRSGVASGMHGPWYVRCVR